MESRKMTIVVDVMGGDFAPLGPVGGAVLALNQYPFLSIVLTGDEEKIKKALEGKTYDAARLTIRPTTEVIENEDHSPVEAIRKKKDSSMVVGLQMVKKKEADGFVSAGSTGALLAGGTFVVGRIKGIVRPALTVPLPAGEHPVLVLDVGANMDCKPAFLVQFARMATIYYKKLYGVSAPKVALLNVGVEEAKGNQMSKEAFEMLKATDGINFVGNMEARDVFSGEYQIVVTDGFAGNVLLKTLEGAASMIMNALKEGIMASFTTKIGGLLIKPSISAIKSKLDPKAVGGCPLLGVDGAVIKAHGNSKEDAFFNAIRQCVSFVNGNVNEEIREVMKQEKEKEASGKEEA